MAKQNSTRRLGSWEIKEELGRGGQAGVLLAEKISLDGTKTQAAIKYIPITEKSSNQSVKLLAHEYKILQRVSSEHTAKVIDSGFEDFDGIEVAWMATELIKGTDLEAEISKYGPLAKDQWLDLAFDIMSGLSAAHQEGVIHCDLKPANIMRDSRHAVIIDFGMGSFVRVADPGDYSGSTPGYEAPEQLDSTFDSQDYEYPVDLFAAGVTLVYAATGWLPWDVSHEYRNAIAGMQKVTSGRAYQELLSAREQLKLQIEKSAPRLDGLDDEQLAIVSPLLAFDPRARGSASETLEKVKSLLPPGSTRRQSSTDYVERRGVAAGSMPSRPGHVSKTLSNQGSSEKSFRTTLALATWLGWIGADRWYLGKYGTALAKTFTYAGFGVWWFIDAMAISNGEVKDSLGRELKNQPKELEPVVRKTKRNFAIAVAALIGIMIYNVSTGVITIEDSSTVGTSSSVVSDSTKMQNLVGLPLDEAEDLIPNLEVATIDVSGDDRAVFLSSNWQVCQQSPEAGTPVDSNTNVELEVVKQREVCP